MRRRIERALARTGHALLAAAAAVGVLLSLVFFLVSTPPGRALLVPRLLRMLDDALAGSIELGSYRLLPQGALVVEGLRVRDPDGEVVLEARRARVDLDLSRLTARDVGLRVEIDAPGVRLRQTPDGAINLARAFASTSPAPERPAPPGAPAQRRGGSTWTIRVERLALRGGEVSFTEADGSPGFTASGVDVDARGRYAGRRSSLELSARGAVAFGDVQGPASAALAATLDGDRLAVETLRASLGATAVEAVAEGDLRERTGRAALVTLALGDAELRALAPRAPVAGDLEGTLYAESDGRRVSAALDVAPRRAGGAGGRARAAAALDLPPGPLAAGFDVAVERLDPARLVDVAPPGELTFTARGRAAGSDLDALRGQVALSLAPSRLRGGRVGPGELVVRARGGRTFELDRLDLTAPGGRVDGSGRFAGGVASGRATLALADVRRFGRNLSALLGRKLPDMSGSARIEASLDSAAAGRSRVRISSPALAYGATAVTGLSLDADLVGPARQPKGRVDGRAARLVSGGFDARAVALSGRVDGRRAVLDASASVPKAGPDPFAVHLDGALARDSRELRVEGLTVAWPGGRFGLVSPATVRFDGPSTTRLELASGDQRVAVEGGLSGQGAKARLGATAELSRVDLASLPRGLLPDDLGLGGILSARAAVSGRPSAPVVEATIDLASARFRDLDGLGAAGQLGYDGARQRVTADLGLRRAAGGELELRADAPVALGRAAPREPLSARIRARDLPLDLVGRLAGEPRLAAGLAAVEIDARGTVGAPEAEVRVEVKDATWEGRGPFALAASAVLPGEEAQLNGAALYQDVTLLKLDGRVPLDLSDLVREPAETLKRLRTAPLELLAELPELAIERLQALGLVPATDRVDGTIAARVEATGSVASPRGKAVVELRGGRYRAYEDVAARVELAAAEDLAVSARASLRGGEVLRLTARLAVPVERLADPAALEAAPLAATVEVPPTQLATFGGGGPDLPLSGTVELAGRIEGTLLAPRAELSGRGRGLAIAGRSLGDLVAKARNDEGIARVELALDATGGGRLIAELETRTSLGLEALRAGRVGEAPSVARLVADRVDLSFLPAVAPDVVRAASGLLGADVVARGPLADLSPEGWVKLVGGRAALAEYGDWRDITLDATLTADRFHVERLEAKRGGGRVALTLDADGFRRPGGGTLKGRLDMKRLTISRSGQDLATIDVEAKIEGTAGPRALKAEVNIPSADVRLPERSPRELQELDVRDDIIVVGAGGRGRAIRFGRGRPGGDAAKKEEPYRAELHVVVPNRFWVRSDNPEMEVELKANLNLTLVGSRLLAAGTVDTVRGRVEPMGGRVFEIDRGRVQFTGGSLNAAVLDVVAHYDNPAAKVEVAISGTTSKPQVKLSSQPPMDDAQIAMLIATGRTELRAGSGGVSDSLTGREAGNAALGAVATGLFNQVIADKLPVDTVELDTNKVRAGTYITDKFYVGYTRHFDAQPERGESVNELRGEYQISPRWQLEIRAGLEAREGGGSLIWSKDY